MKDTFIEDKLNNWGRWMIARLDGGSGGSWSLIARMQAQPSSSDAHCVIPINSVEASQTDDAIQTLDKDLQSVALYWYSKEWTREHIRKKLGWGSTNRVDAAKQAIRSGVTAYFEALAGKKRVMREKSLKNHLVI